MYFKNAQLKNFRNFRNFETEFIPQVNIILGDNGQGKTNLIESLYLLSQGDSFRYADNSTFIFSNSSAPLEPAIVRAKIESRDLENQLALEITKDKKTHYLNQKKSSGPALKKLFPVVLFSPESLSIIKESDEHRRELLDDVLLCLGEKSADSVRNYRKVLKMRNGVLRNIRDLEKFTEGQKEILLSLNPLFLQAAVELTQQRLKLIEELLEDLNNSGRKLLKSPASVDISVEYVVSDQKITENSTEMLSETMRKRMLQLESAEMASGTSLVGPHKHDIRFLYDQKDSRFFCSQGQQRALIISFKMAQIVYHRKALKSDPVLMLDDVLSELDQDKRMALVNFLRDFSSQIFITSTDINLPDLGQDWRTSVKRIKQGFLE